MDNNFYFIYKQKNCYLKRSKNSDQEGINIYQ